MKMAASKVVRIVKIVKTVMGNTILITVVRISPIRLGGGHLHVNSTAFSTRLSAIGLQRRQPRSYIQ